MGLAALAVTAAVITAALAAAGTDTAAVAMAVAMAAASGAAAAGRPVLFVTSTSPPETDMRQRDVVPTVHILY